MVAGFSGHASPGKILIAGGQRWSRARFLIFPLFCLLPVSLMSGCSGNEEEQKKTSAVEQMTDSAAQEAVDSIRLPMQKAQQVQELQDAYLKAMDEAVETGGRQ